VRERAAVTPMSVRPILKFGEPVLHTPAEKVGTFDDRLAGLFVDMVDTMYAAPGIGLAAPQIGVPLRAIVLDLSVGEDPAQLIQLVNPELVERDGSQRHDEGCLSVPGFEGAPPRPERVVVKGQSIAGDERTYTATGLLARAFCHEIDHLDGLLFVDRLSPLRRDLLKRRLRKRFRHED
jgi:peptide deformylase